MSETTRSRLRGQGKSNFSHRLLLITGSAVAGRCTRNDAAIGQCDAPGIDQVGSVFRAVAINNDHVTEFEIAAFETSSRKSTRRPRFAAPSDSGPVLLFHIDVKVRVWIRPFNFGESACEAESLTRIEFRS